MTGGDGSGSVPVRLDPGQLEALAGMVADQLADRLADAEKKRTLPPGGGLVDAAALGAELGLSAATIRAKTRAGVIPAHRAGSGPRARLRFDVDAAREALAPPERPAGAPRKPRTRRARPGARPEGGWRVEAPSG